MTALLSFLSFKPCPALRLKFKRRRSLLMSKLNWTNLTKMF